MSSASAGCLRLGVQAGQQRIQIVLGRRGVGLRFRRCRARSGSLRPASSASSSLVSAASAGAAAAGSGSGSAGAAGTGAGAALRRRSGGNGRGAAAPELAGSLPLPAPNARPAACRRPPLNDATRTSGRPRRLTTGITPSAADLGRELLGEQPLRAGQRDLVAVLRRDTHRPAGRRRWRRCQAPSSCCRVPGLGQQLRDQHRRVGPQHPGRARPDG